MVGGLNSLKEAVTARKPSEAAQAAIDVGQFALDLELRYRSPAEINADRFVLWTQQLRVDAAAGLEWIRDRIADTLGAAGRREVDGRLRDLQAAADARNLPSAADHAARLAARLRETSCPRADRGRGFRSSTSLPPRPWATTRTRGRRTRSGPGP
jgi:hypothetical protein